MDRQAIQRRAEDLLHEHGFWGRYPVPVDKLALKLGYEPVWFDPDEESLEVSGAVDHEARRIYVNRADSVVRQRFTLAHEIGHVVLHGGRSTIDYRQNLRAPGEPREREANQFAAELLMPEQPFRNAWARTWGDLDEIARFFGVSVPAATVRAETLKLFDPW